jgi:hypothetical protein
MATVFVFVFDFQGGRSLPAFLPGNYTRGSKLLLPRV